MNYLPADDSFIVNCGNPDGSDPDNSLKPIRISLPKPPKLELIDGYGLPPEEQYWRRPEIPSKLISLEKQVKHDLELRLSLNKNERITGYKIIDEIWDRIEENIEYYSEEIAWIKKQWWHRIYGYFFFNNGKPTYISGEHYFYLSFWKIESKLYPDYRDRDRKNFLFWHYSKTTNETFEKLDKDGIAIPNNDGSYNMVEMPVKISFGVCQPKNRRGGTTNMAQAMQFEDTTRKSGALGVIFSMTQTSALALFSGKTVKSFSNIPFFFLPMWPGYFEERTSIEFKKPKNIILGDHLNSKITFAQSAMGQEFDGEKLSFAIFDESGKTSECQVDERWQIHKQGMALGDGLDIIGFSIHPSTVEDMDSSGGIYYQSLINDSNFYERNPVTGQTKSGLFRLLFPGYEGLEGFIDKFGQSIINEPTTDQIRLGYKFRHGSKKHLQSNRDILLKSKDPRDQIKYRRLIVKFPFTLDECFRLTVGNTSWDMEAIDKRLSELGRMKDPYLRGDFKWENNVRFGRVIFVPNINGKFEVSYILSSLEANQKSKITIVDPISGDYKDAYAPMYQKKGVIGSDAFKFKGDKELVAATSSYQSDGGICARRLRDYNIDPEDKSIYDCQTPCNVASYRNRPLSEEYNEDVLMCAIYYGYMIYPETNAGTIWEFCLKYGYDGYLLYDIDVTTGRYKTRPGTYTVEKSKELGWTLIQNYVSYEAHREKHGSILREIAKLKQFTDLNKLDLAASFMCSLLGEYSLGMQQLESTEDSEGAFDWWVKF